MARVTKKKTKKKTTKKSRGQGRKKYQRKNPNRRDAAKRRVEREKAKLRTPKEKIQKVVDSAKRKIKKQTGKLPSTARVLKLLKSRKGKMALFGILGAGALVALGRAMGVKITPDDYVPSEFPSGKLSREKKQKPIPGNIDKGRRGGYRKGIIDRGKVGTRRGKRAAGNIDRGNVAKGRGTQIPGNIDRGNVAKGRGRKIPGNIDRGNVAKGRGTIIPGNIDRGRRDPTPGNIDRGNVAKGRGTQIPGNIDRGNVAKGRGRKIPGNIDRGNVAKGRGRQIPGNIDRGNVGSPRGKGRKIPGNIDRGNVAKGRGTQIPGNIDRGNVGRGKRFTTKDADDRLRGGKTVEEVRAETKAKKAKSKKMAKGKRVARGKKRTTKRTTKSNVRKVSPRTVGKSGVQAKGSQLQGRDREVMSAKAGGRRIRNDELLMGAIATGVAASVPEVYKTADKITGWLGPNLKRLGLVGLSAGAIYGISKLIASKREQDIASARGMSSGIDRIERGSGNSRPKGDRRRPRSMGVYGRGVKKGKGRRDRRRRNRNIMRQPY